MTGYPIQPLSSGKRFSDGLLLLPPLLIGVAAVLVAACGSVKGTPIPSPPAESARWVSFMASDGVELKGRVFGRGETGVVLAHMHASDQRVWWPFAQMLKEQGYMALTFNFRGYGEGEDLSGGDKEEIESIPMDVDAAMKFLRAQGASVVFLAGASMGAAASLKAAAGEDIRGVVALSAPVDFRGLSLRAEKVRVPVLILAVNGDRGAKNSAEVMIDQGIVGEDAEFELYSGGADHGSDILFGRHGDDARSRILRFFEERTQKAASSQ